MTAVANPPSFSNINRQAWGINGGQQSLNSMNPDEVRGVFMPRKTVSRTNSSSSMSSTSSASSTATATTTNGQTNGAPAPAAGDLGNWPNAAPRKRPQGKGQWNQGRAEGGTELGRMPTVRALANGLNGVSGMSPSPVLPSTGQMTPQRSLAEPLAAGTPVLWLLSLNGTFERKTISVPFYPDTLRIGRQTNAKTVPTPINGFFDSKVLSRQHAEIWADRQGKIWIRDIKSSNGTFVNGTRLSQENRESEPHELQTQDHLELGIDIVSEDSKSVVHHKVAAKVEHAGFVNPANNLLDMNFGDLDPANGGMMVSQAGGMPFRSRTGSQASAGSNGRMPMTASMMGGAQANGMAYNRGFLMTTVTTENIVKKLRNEMRNARQQAQDLGRTGKFLDALLSQDDLKNQEKPEVPEPPKAPLVNGNSHSFRSDAKTRFSDPPAPPPQQPLPEKPDVARPHGAEVPSLKRVTTERPKSVPSNTSPIRPDNLGQILQLTEALNNAKREIDTQTAKMKDLEEMLQKEREAREAAEELAKRLEEDVHVRGQNGSAKSSAEDSILDEAFEPPIETIEPQPSERHSSPPTESKDETSTILQTQIDTMLSEMRELREHVGLYKRQAEQATSERDADRKTLAEMVSLIRQRDEEAAALKAAARSMTRSRSNGRARSQTIKAGEDSRGRSIGKSPNGRYSELDSVAEDDLEEKPTLSRANTITPTSSPSAKRMISDQAVIETIPYASMVGVVLLGMGLMAYLNGWQTQPRLDR